MVQYDILRFFGYIKKKSFPTVCVNYTMCNSVSEMIGYTGFFFTLVKMYISHTTNMYLKVNIQYVNTTFFIY